MKWANLKHNKCPKCGRKLGEGDENYLRCEKKSCAFFIRREKAEVIMRNFGVYPIELREPMPKLAEIPNPKYAAAGEAIPFNERTQEESPANDDIF